MVLTGEGAEQLLSIYLDHTATTRPTDHVIHVLSDELKRNYANPSSLHAAGKAVSDRLAQVKEAMADKIGCPTRRLLLTSGGTESINMAIKGPFMRQSHLPRRIIISRGEHAAVRESASYLERQGCVVERLPLTPDGTVDLNALEQALKKPAGLISLIHVSNETGAVNPVSDLVSLCRMMQPNMLIHLDTVQTWGKLSFLMDQADVDFVSASGHKFHAPKGTGFLAFSERAQFEPLLHGGGQQHNLRSGTENLPSAAALEAAFSDALDQLHERCQAVEALSVQFKNTLKSTQIDYKVVSPASAVPHILTLVFPMIRGETLVNALSAQEIYVSSGSACSSKKNSVNPVLQAMGMDPETARCSIRVSFSADNTSETVKTAALAIADMCRRYGR